MLFVRSKMAAILWNYEQLGQNFTLTAHSRTTKGYVHAKYIIVISVTCILRALEPAQRFEHTFWILCNAAWKAIKNL